jgi:phosphate transport system protein
MSERHTLRLFDQELQMLSSEIATLFIQVTDELNGALEVLASGDAQRAAAVILSDSQTDALMERIGRHTNRILARQQAMANDLRAIMGANRIAPHLERIGDYAKSAAKRRQRLTHPIDPVVINQFEWMIKRLIAMLQRVGEAYSRNDAEVTNLAWADDAEIDAIYAKLFAHLLQQMASDSSLIHDSTQLLFIAKGLERAGDHVTDIAEEIHMMVTGHAMQGTRPKVDEQG